MLVDRSALSGIAVEMVRSSSSHPLCPCGRRRHCSRGVPLVSGTSATRRASIRIVQPSLRIGASRWVTRGLPDSRSGCVSRDVADWPPLAAAPVGSAWVVLGPTRWTLPDDLHGGEAMSGSQIPASERPEGQLLAADLRRSPDTWQAAFAGVRGACCSPSVRESWQSQPPRWERRPPGPFPSVGA